METISSVAWAVLVGAGIIALGAIGLKLIGQWRTDPNVSPTQQAILDALEPFIWRGILAGEQLALKGMNDLDVTITGWDKAAIANAVYDLIPDTIMIGERSVPVKLVKQLVSRQAFIQAVKDIYDAGHAFILKNEDYLINQVADLKDAIQGSVKQPSVPDLRAILPPGEQG